MEIANKTKGQYYIYRETNKGFIQSFTLSEDGVFHPLVEFRPKKMFDTIEQAREYARMHFPEFYNSCVCIFHEEIRMTSSIPKFSVCLYREDSEQNWFDRSGKKVLFGDREIFPSRDKALEFIAAHHLRHVTIHEDRDGYIHLHGVN